jgi:16S rRNA (guanine527-N7)-methyltransferase
MVEARARGLLGPGPVESHLDHALGFAAALEWPFSGVALDLGSGGGIPGLVLALRWRQSRWTLLDARSRSVRFLRAAVEALGLGARVAVIEARAESLAHERGFRGSAGLVVARACGPPAVTAEYAAGFLEQGGRLVVSEPPGSTGDRWSPAGLAVLGMGAAWVVASPGRHGFAVIEQRAACPCTYPRRAGVPAKRPLF